MDDLDIVYVCIIVLIIIIIYMNVTSNSYYTNVVIKNAFDDLNKNPKIKNLNPNQGGLAELVADYEKRSQL